MSFSSSQPATAEEHLPPVRNQLSERVRVQNRRRPVARAELQNRHRQQGHLPETSDRPEERLLVRTEQHHAVSLPKSRAKEDGGQGLLRDNIARQGARVLAERDGAEFR